MSLVRDVTLPEVMPHELFELRASAAPSAIALRFGTEHLSYAQLNARANRLARSLASLGVEPESRVAVFVEPSVELVVALLALLKLGAVYVPLDPSYPAARIQAMLDDLCPSVVLTQRALRDRVASAGAARCELDGPSAELSAFSDENLGLASDPDRTAYIYYTSGTTGTPKGVMASYANLASYIGLANRRYGFTSTDVGLALARFGFSISMFELLSPLVAGGTLLMLERAQVLDFERLCQALREATFFHAGPSLLRGLLGHIERHAHWASPFLGIRHASSGGDMVPVEVLEGLRRVFPNAEVFVIYGCSEISCMGTTYPVPRGAPLARSYVGTPFPGVVTRVVDEQLGDVAVGVVGEVLFAGPGLVKGYWKRPELTSEKFVEQGGRRWYRTGDRGRLDALGVLELVGRTDFQLKLSGIRIEPGDIEHHLRRVAGVSNAVVGVREVGGEKTLVAYVVVEKGDPRDPPSRAAAIRKYLTEQLPDYMVPSMYVELAELPLNHNLKLDRRALPDPPREAVRIAAGPAAPLETPMEERLAALWRAVLRIDRVGRSDNFFELGGTSLLALQLLSLVDRELGVVLGGLEVLRESLELQARLCEQRSGRAASPGQAAATAPEQIEPFHFGPEGSLYGVLHGPSQGADMAVLVCAPLGHEYLRAHFVLQRLARRLASAGAAVLRFDYYGCGDSVGKSSEATCDRFQADIVAAHRELVRRTNATQVVAVGVRLGATLLASVAPRLNLKRVVLWDPVADGSEYLAQLAAAQRRLARSAPGASFRARWRRPLGAQELLGASYSRAMLRDLAALRLSPGVGGSCPVETLSSRSAWLELAELENMLPDVGISQALSERVRGTA